MLLAKCHSEQMGTTMTKFQKQTAKLLRINDKNIAQKLRIMTIFFLSILTLMVAYTGLTLFQQKSDGLIVNIAGRQRMLTQKFTKEFFLSLQNGKGRSELTEKTRKLFDVSLTALQSGGETFRDVSMKKPVTIDGTSILAIHEKLNEVSYLWAELQKSADTINPENQNLAQLAHINKLSVKTLVAMNQGVGMFAKAADNKVATLQYTLLGLWILAITLSLTIASIIANSVVTPVQIMVDISQKLAGGNFTRQHASSEIHGEMSILAGNMDTMRMFLNEIIHSIKQNMQQMFYSSGQISTISAEISEANKREHESSKLVLQSTDSLRHIAEIVFEQIDQAKNDVEQTRNHAQEGVAIVHRNIEELTATVESVNVTSRQLEELKNASEQINKITGSIQEIADQTNLLALNATIEAARAGDAGKGFAVVASEIKELARQTADATTEITGLITSLTTQVDESVHSMQDVVNKVHLSQEQSQETVAAFESMNEGVARTLEATDIISGHSQEQTSQLESLRDQLSDFFAVLTENMKKADDTAMIANNLNVVADKINGALVDFIIDDVERPDREQNEKRNFPRLDNNIICQLQQGNTSVNGISNDISMTGFLIQCHEKLQMDTNTAITLTLPAATEADGYKELQGAVKIKRQIKRNGSFFYGVEFITMDNKTRNGMQEIIKYFKKRAQFS